MQCPSRHTRSERPSSPAEYLVLFNYFSSVPETPVSAPSSSPTRSSLWWRWTNPHTGVVSLHLHSILRVSTAQSLTTHINELAAEKRSQTSGSGTWKKNVNMFSFCTLSNILSIMFNKCWPCLAQLLTVYLSVIDTTDVQHQCHKHTNFPDVQRGS